MLRIRNRVTGIVGVDWVDWLRRMWDMRVLHRPPTDDQSPVTVDGSIQRTGDVEERNPSLVAALHDLDGTMEEAAEDGFRPPSGLAVDNARRLLKSMFQAFPRRYEIYPTPDAEVAIDAHGGPGASVIVLCESDGGALCLVNIGDCQRRARYSAADTLPDGFVEEALLELQAFGSRPR